MSPQHAHNECAFDTTSSAGEAFVALQSRNLQHLLSEVGTVTIPRNGLQRKQTALPKSIRQAARDIHQSDITSVAAS